MPLDEVKNKLQENPLSLIIIVLNLISLCVFLGVLIMTIPNGPLMSKAFTYLTYYIILAMTVVWAVSLVNLYQYKQANAFIFIQRHWKGILASFLLASIVFVSVPKYFRVLSDETNLLSVAKSMTYNKNVENITEGRWYYEMFWAKSTQGIEKRPFLFPFFTSLTHTFLGYRVENVFVLNYFALWVMLFLLYIAIQSSLGNLWAISGLVLVMAQPVISLSATSGSFEIFNFLFIMASFLVLKAFLNDPNHKTFIALVMTLIMLANVRYESILFLAIVLAVLAITGLIKSKFFTHSFIYGLIPFLLLPWIWQRVLLASGSDPNLVGGSWTRAFGVENFQHNIVLFFKYILDPGGQLGYAGGINIIAIIALVLFVIIVLSSLKIPTGVYPRMFSSAPILWICSAISLLVLFIVVVSYQGGINDHPLNGRLYMPILIVFSIVPVYFFAHILKDRQKLAVPVFVCALAVFAYYHPIAVEDRLTNNLQIVREYRYVDAFLKKNADKNTLIICGRPGQLIVSNYGAITYGTANQETDAILEQLKNHLFSKIYVIQSIAYNTNAPLKDNVINPRYQLEDLDELQITGSYYFRISRVKQG